MRGGESGTRVGEKSRGGSRGGSRRRGRQAEVRSSIGHSRSVAAAACMHARRRRQHTPRHTRRLHCRDERRRISSTHTRRQQLIGGGGASRFTLCNGCHPPLQQSPRWLGEQRAASSEHHELTSVAGKFGRVTHRPSSRPGRNSSHTPLTPCSPSRVAVTPINASSSPPPSPSPRSLRSLVRARRGDSLERLVHGLLKVDPGSLAITVLDTQHILILCSSR